MDAPAEKVRERLGRWATVEDADEPGTCRVHLSTDSLDWAAFTLLAVGTDFEVVAPPELRAHLQGWTERLGRAIG